MKKIFSTAILFLFVISFLSLLFYSNHKKKESERYVLQENLLNLIQQNIAKEIHLIDISLVTPFEWDTLYIFQPYTSLVRIDKSLNSYWIEGRFFSTNIKYSDGICLLIFQKNGKVVQYLDFPRSNGDFYLVGNETGISFSDCKFYNNEKNDMKWVKDQ